jgi:Domain of unknown function (DUF4262)
MTIENPFGSELRLLQWLDQEDAWMRDTVRRHGWAVQAVFGVGCWGHPGCDCGQPPGTNPSFAYTVGLYGFGHPELVVFGLCADTAMAVLNELGERVRHGQTLRPGEVLTFECWPPRSGTTSTPRPTRCPRCRACGTTGRGGSPGNPAMAHPLSCSRCPAPSTLGSCTPPRPSGSSCLVSLPPHSPAPYYGLDL